MIERWGRDFTRDRRPSLSKFGRLAAFLVAFAGVVGIGGAAATPELRSKRVLIDVPAVSTDEPGPVQLGDTRIGGLLVWLELEGLVAPALKSGVVLLPGCNGPTPHHEAWARQVARWGYMTLLLDSGGTLDQEANRDRACTASPAAAAARADAAKAYLVSRPFAAADRVAVVTWGSDTAFFWDRPRQADDASFRAFVGIGPACPSAGATGPSAATFVLLGGEESAVDVAPCIEIAGPGGDGRGSVQVQLYPQNHLDAADPIVRLDVKKRVQKFLAGRLKFRRTEHGDGLYDAPGAFDGFADAYGTDTERRDWIGHHVGQWAVDPDIPGPDLPPVGRSAFDRLFAGFEDGGPVYDLPYPFDALLDELERRVAPGAKRRPYEAAIIPRGRSLQRESARPDYFKYPRVVIAVTGEIEDVPAGWSPVYLKDRLYLGYVEKTNVLEVISYNWQAERFEFQVVRDYGAGLTPMVFYARRVVCRSCHQNAAPIFADGNWLESNSNTEVAKRLLAERSSFFGLPAKPGSSPVVVVDFSTDRANLLPTLQMLWRRGCGGAADRDKAIRCRGQAFLHMLQFRLSQKASFDTASAGFQQDLRDVLRDSWRRQWPGGVYVPDPDLPDRDPFSDSNQIAGARDPLTSRLPVDIWSSENDTHLKQIVTGLSTGLAVADIRRLDRFLVDQADAAGADDETWRAACADDQTGSPPRSVRNSAFSCAADGLEVNGSLTLVSGGDPRVALANLTFVDGTRYQRPTVALADTGDADERLLRLAVQHRRAATQLRLADGRSIAALTLALEDRPEGRPVAVGVEVAVRPDFAVVEAAVDRLVDATLDGRSDVFGDRPFNGRLVMAAVFRELGLAPTDWCCAPDQLLPPALVDRGDDVGLLSGLTGYGIDRDVVATFSQYCSSCHATGNDTPPNFLAGPTRRVAKALRHCAPRLLRRLAAWDIPDGERSHSPMPPIAALGGHGIEVEDWRQSADLARLRQYVLSQIDTTDEIGRDVDYEALPTCLPVKN